MPPSRFGTYQQLATSLAKRLQALRSPGTSDVFLQWLDEPIAVLVPSHAAAAAISQALLAESPGGFSGILFETAERFALALASRDGKAPRVASTEERRIAMAAAVAADLRSIRGIAPMLERSYRDLRDSGHSLDDFAAAVPRLRRPARARNMLQSYRRYENLIARLGALDPADLLELAAQRIRSGASISKQIVFGFYDTTGVQQKLLDALERAGAVDSLYIPIPIENGSVSDGYQFAHRFVADYLAGSEPIEIPHPDRRLSVTSAESRSEELRLVCSRTRALLDGGTAPEKIAIVARSLDPEESSLLAGLADEYAIPLAIGTEIPLHAHPFGRALLTLLRVRQDDFPRTAMVSLIRDGMVHLPDVARIDLATRRLGIAAGRGVALTRVDDVLSESRSYDRQPFDAYLAALREVETLADSLASLQSGAEWGDAVDRLVSRFRPRTDRDLGAIEALTSIAAVLRRCSVFETEMTAEDVALMIRSADPIDIAHERRREVWYGDVMSLRGRSFDHLFCFAMQHDRFPQRRNEDPLLPNHDRLETGMRVIDDGRAEERLLFNMVSNSASSVHFSLAAEDDIGRLLRPSSLLQNYLLGREPDPASRALIFGDFHRYVASTAPSSAFGTFSPTRSVGEKAVEWVGLDTSRNHREPSPPRFSAGEKVPKADEGADTTPHPARQAESAREAMRRRRIETADPSLFSPRLRRAIELAGRPGRRTVFDGIVQIDETLASTIRERLAAISATHLEDFGACPQRFLFRRLLGADEIEDPELEAQINARKKGTLDHLILERFYREMVGSLPIPTGNRLATADSARLRSIIEEEFDRFDGQQPPASPLIRKLERDLTHRDLDLFLAEDIRDLRERSLLPLHSEYSFGTNRRGVPDHPDAITLALASDVVLRVHGIIDRIDANGDQSRIRIVDYKSGVAFNQRKLSQQIVEGTALQLALYAAATEVIFQLPPTAISGAVKPLRDLKSKDFKFDFAEVREPFMESLSVFTTSILSGLFPAIPHDSNCHFCPMKSSCRALHEERAPRKAESALHLLLGWQAESEAQR